LLGVKEMRWRFLKVVPDGQRFELDGANVWSIEWKRVPNQRAEIKDPLYGQSYSFEIFEFTHEGKVVRFAAGEFSNCMWGFYEPLQ
jgi:hypothetical protein